MGLLDIVKREVKSITIEPVIILFITGISLVNGAQLNTNLLIWKICRLELNYTSEVCDNLTLDIYDKQNDEVQKRVADIQTVGQYLSGAPALIYSLFAGSLSDEFGRKPLMMLPLFGCVLTDITLLVNYIFIETLPIEFFYFERLWFFFGGISVMYLGVYGYVATITTSEDRAYRLARLDGCETGFKLLATLVSPFIFDKFGYYASFGSRIACSVLAFLYVTFLVKEPIVHKADITQPKTSMVEKINMYFIIPVKDMIRTLFKTRPNHMRILIFMQLFTYGLYWMLVDENLDYLYMLKSFEGFDYADYATFNIFLNGISGLGLLIFVPILSRWLGMHDALIQTIIAFTESLSLLLVPFMSTLWQFYLARTVGFMWASKWSITRSLISKSVESSELGKALSGIAIVAAIAPFAQTPAFRGLYKVTLDRFPGAVYLLASGMMFLAILTNFTFYLNRNAFAEQSSKNDKEQEKMDTALQESNTYIGMQYLRSKL